MYTKSDSVFQLIGQKNPLKCYFLIYATFSKIQQVMYPISCFSGKIQDNKNLLFWPNNSG